MVKEDKKLDILLKLLLLVKIVWVVTLFSRFITTQYYPNYVSLNEKIEKTLHNIFMVLIGILLVYLFNHLTTYSVCISGHAKFYLYSFGILSIVGVIQKEIHRRVFHELI